MMRSLWTAASGMMSQQTSVDTIANNLANVNTVGYKQEQTQFKSLLYQNLQAKTTSANGENKPVGAQVGLGSRVSAVTSIYTQGALNATDSTTDFAINGDGFFAVRNTNTDETVYTRNGHFTWATATEGVMLSTSEGYPVLSADGAEIVLGQDANGKDYKTNLILLIQTATFYILTSLTIRHQSVLRLAYISFLILQDWIRLVEATFQRLRRQELHLTKRTMKLERRAH